MEHTLTPAVVPYEPAEQLVQTAEDVAPTAVEYVPALHREHTLRPCVDAYDPAVQFVHTEALASEKVPAEQGEHVPSPAALVNVPAEHGVQDGEPAVEEEPAGHGRHCEMDVPPAVGRYVPAGQLTHVPVPEEYWPATQLGALHCVMAVLVPVTDTMTLPVGELRVMSLVPSLLVSPTNAMEAPLALAKPASLASTTRPRMPGLTGSATLSPVETNL